MLKKWLFPVLMLCFSAALAQKKNIELIQKTSFDKIVDGKQVRLFTLKNNHEIIAQITNYGGKVVSLFTPDRLDNIEDIVLGYDNIDDYLTSEEKYFGALIGRYGNRIAKGKFVLNDKEYTLATNNGPNTLHGGNKGFDAVVWDANQINGQTLELTYISMDGEEGYPGNLNIRVRYTLTDANELKIEYWATTDEPTIINLTHHSFFNLKGGGKGTINDHLLQINSAFFTPIDESLIPTGKIAAVEDTPFDFRELTSIGSRLTTKNKQLEFGNGYDHNFVLNQALHGFNFAAKVIEPVTGRVMEVFTNEPGLQFYGGNFLDGSIVGKNQRAYEYRTAFCLETQHFPDSPNHDHFPNTVLNPDEEYYSICVYKFSVSR